MKDSALSIANYFIDIAHNQKDEIKPLRLMKLVYMAHGYMLAILGKSVLNPRFDKVEAWKYGPVIPSVYHSFKIYGNSPITEKTVVITDEAAEKDNDERAIVETPVLSDAGARKICDFVWERYSKFNDNELVTITHKKDTPWALVYEEGKNNEIPDQYTKVYFTKLYEALVNWVRNGE